MLKKRKAEVLETETRLSMSEMVHHLNGLSNLWLEGDSEPQTPAYLEARTKFFDRINSFNINERVKILADWARLYTPPPGLSNYASDCILASYYQQNLAANPGLVTTPLNSGYLPVWFLIHGVRPRALRVVIDSNLSPKIEERLIVKGPALFPTFLSDIFFSYKATGQVLLKAQNKTLGASLIAHFTEPDLANYTQFLVENPMPSFFGANEGDFEIYAKICESNHYNPSLLLRRGNLLSTLADFYYNGIDSDDKFFNVKKIVITPSILTKMQNGTHFCVHQNHFYETEWLRRGRERTGAKTRALVLFLNKYNTGSEKDFVLQDFIEEENELFLLIPRLYNMQILGKSFLEYIALTPQDMCPAIIYCLETRYPEIEKSLLVSLIRALIMDGTQKTFEGIFTWVMQGKFALDHKTLNELLNYALDFREYAHSVYLSRWIFRSSEATDEVRQTLINKMEEWLNYCNDDVDLIREVYPLAHDYNYLEYALSLIDRMKLPENETLRLKFPIYQTIFIATGDAKDKNQLLNCFETMTGLRSKEFQPLINILTDPLPTAHSNRIRESFQIAKATGQPMLPALFQAYKPKTAEMATQTEDSAFDCSL